MNAMNSAAPLIEARGICKDYGSFSLAGIDLAVASGEVVGFIGKNGSGKTTTVKALLGLIGLDGGEAAVLGVPARELSRTARGAVAKEHIGVVFDGIALLDHLTVGEVGRLMRRAYTTWDQTVYEGYLERFELAGDPKRTVKELSRGMGMKLQLACALSHDARLLILDEATAGLDPMARDEVLDILRAFVDEEDPAGNPLNGILMSSHITSDLDKIADTVVCIDEGRSVFCKSKDEICDQMGIARCRERDVETIVAAENELAGEGGANEPLRALRHKYGIDVLAPDRFAFAEAFPSIPCDRMTIDDYMAFSLKGERLSKGGDVR